MAIGSDKPDLVLFAGPVVLKPAFDVVPWERPTVVEEVHALQDTSASYRQLGQRSLEEIVNQFTGQSTGDFNKIAIAAFSKGGSFTDQLMRDPTSRARVSAVVLNDAVFGSQHAGLQEVVDEAADGKKLVVITNTNNQASPTIPKRARESVEDVIGDDLGPALVDVEPAEGMPRPSGGVWNMGKFFWYDYVQPNGVNDISHGAHHDLAPATWTAHLVPHFSSGKFSMLLAAVGAMTLVGTVVWFSRRK